MEDFSSPTAPLESIFVTTTIYGYEGLDIMVMDVTNAFIENNIPPKKDGK